MTTTTNLLLPLIASGQLQPDVTHNEAITGLADQVIELRDGRVVRDELNPHPLAARDLDW